MRVTYDGTVDAAYIHLTDETLTPGRDSLPLNEVLTKFGAMVVIDWKDGKIVGLEVLGASRILHPDLLAQAVPPRPG